MNFLKSHIDISAAVGTLAAELLVILAYVLLSGSGTSGLSTLQLRTAAPAAVNLAGVAAAEGSSLSAARADHTHSLSGLLTIANCTAASAAVGGCVTTAAQTIAGAKTFNAKVSAYAGADVTNTGGAPTAPIATLTQPMLIQDVGTIASGLSASLHLESSDADPRWLRFMPAVAVGSFGLTKSGSALVFGRNTGSGAATTLQIHGHNATDNGITIDNTTGRTDIVQETWTAPTFSGTWTNTGGGNMAAAYMKDSAGFVHLRGVVTAGTVNTAIFTLPVGYRPSLTVAFPSGANGAYCQIAVTGVGVVQQQSSASPTNTLLDGILFDTR